MAKLTVKFTSLKIQNRRTNTHFKHKLVGKWNYRTGTVSGNCHLGFKPIFTSSKCNIDQTQGLFSLPVLSLNWDLRHLSQTCRTFFIIILLESGFVLPWTAFNIMWRHRRKSTWLGNRQCLPRSDVFTNSANVQSKHFCRSLRHVRYVHRKYIEDTHGAIISQFAIVFSINTAHMTQFYRTLR